MTRPVDRAFPRIFALLNSSGLGRAKAIEILINARRNDPVSGPGSRQWIVALASIRRSIARKPSAPPPRPPLTERWLPHRPSASRASAVDAGPSLQRQHRG
jgi:hypothetical protein